jgi:hypothetical protein
MKKIFAYIVAILLLSACSSDAASVASPSQSTVDDPQSSSSKITPVNSSSSESSKDPVPMKLKIHVNDTTFTATLADNSSATALKELLQKGDLTLDMEDFSNFEKVADLPTTLPRNDTQIDTDAGDLILYLGKRIVIYYDKNSWNFTRLGKIDNVNKKRLKQILGDGNATVTFSVK